MLSIKEAVHKGHVVSVFHLTPGEGPLQETLSEVESRLGEPWFRCGAAPREGQSPLPGRVAFIRMGEAKLHPAALVALSPCLCDQFDVICVQDGPERYIVSVVHKRTTLNNYSVGDCIPITEVREHGDPWAASRHPRRTDPGETSPRA